MEVFDDTKMFGLGYEFTTDDLYGAELLDAELTGGSAVTKAMIAAMCIFV